MIRNKFEVKGLFYESHGYRCRKYLDIKRKSSNKISPDIMVVMMNPGSSFPIDKNNNNHYESEAVPDKTQDQIMKVMENLEFDFARIVNLSDLRTPKSADLYKFINSNKSKAFPHSIFDHKRKNEFDRLFIKKVPVIFGWGVNPALSSLAEEAIKLIDNSTIVGLLKDGSKTAYYHPLPQVYGKQIEWVNKVSNMLEQQS